MKAYKLFRLKDGKLYPLYVYSNEVVNQNVWINAKEGPKTKGNKVKSSNGELHFRPGWHSCEVPYAGHIGKRQNGELVQRKEHTWCEIEVSDKIDYTPIAHKSGTCARKRELNYLPIDGYYYYKTNAAATVNWLISGAIKIVKILTNEEVDAICLLKGITPQKREQ